ncbi:MAG: UDP-N-acetylmuramate:L-alanyl-gamma-D-glutamyl-meso-diaminopimelate ligase [Acidobacteria bacterium]|nr:UDP-N-acetylmuramate:L-alanyl-gamma-D-glutamyl-meso-diaminopimelate ligase [Acidobacteriota bacterium]NIM62345.1 UDP-N-acetylmuramate:L-alanyl-gamma-D-glutamyl-meso-diaminopimelate ligase [Acidobacteriota bacterium]NIO59856.1 UDP-N-acetylmuramate:L-alanyl-gamma-D-glutamyl-meso-diaminopimelate ligase [Acidobacteriota bacterium]NIQ30941.1 UDP-N-acetylmuramate:L-alanyl-gamma-D-glutamyl-meso-diaminopimelate ligase [Acidobacteriota bacterium]NIQ86017.1 UDP-N-acetylmuramate:L-alanyl-gamma-D-glutam
MAKEHIHLIGIGGTGMTSLAGLLHESGCRVTGSDGALYPPTSTILADLGVEVYEGFDAAHLDPAPDLVVVGNAISRGNEEAEAVLDGRLRYTSMPRLIHDRFLVGRHSIVIAGTHGKTTTASMLAAVLTRAGREPGYLIGGLPHDLKRPFAVGNGPAFVIEGDEYDTAFFDKGPKFMHYRPDTALLGTVEFDHADIYRDLEQIQLAFRRLINLVPRRGRIVRYEECAVTREITEGAMATVEGYGMHAGLWRAEDLSERPDGSSFRIVRDGQPFAEIDLKLSGPHNVRNALSVVVAAHEQGLSAEEIAAGLNGFSGVRRRLELRGVRSGVSVFDDFAHHPTAIEETLKAVRNRTANGRVWAILEPRSWSLRRNVFQRRLAEVFDAADEIVVAPVFRPEQIPAENRLDVPALVETLIARGAAARHIVDVESIVERVVDEAADGDVVVVMSNGGFDGLHDRLLEALAARAADPSRVSS